MHAVWRRGRSRCLLPRTVCKQGQENHLTRRNSLLGSDGTAGEGRPVLEYGASKFLSCVYTLVSDYSCRHAFISSQKSNSKLIFEIHFAYSSPTFCELRTAYCSKAKICRRIVIAIAFFIIVMRESKSSWTRDTRLVASRRIYLE